MNGSCKVLHSFRHEQEDAQLLLESIQLLLNYVEEFHNGSTSLERNFEDSALLTMLLEDVWKLSSCSRIKSINATALRLWVTFQLQLLLNATSTMYQVMPDRIELPLW